MNIVVIGSGYVGLVTGCCLAEAGNRVVCVDHDSQKVAALQSGRVPFYEPELDVLLQSQIESGRLSFETRIARAMPDADVVFLAVGTPPLADGNANLDNLLSCTRELADTAFKDGIVVIKSTVPVGTGDLVERLLNEGRRQHTGQPLLQVVSTRNSWPRASSPGLSLSRPRCDRFRRCARRRLTHAPLSTLFAGSRCPTGDGSA